MFLMFGYVFLLFAVCSIVFYYDISLKEIFLAASAIDIKVLGFASCAFFVVFFLVVVRLKIIYRVFSCAISFPMATRLALYGQLGSNLGIAGNLASHMLANKSRVIPAAIKLFVPLLEKIIMFFVGGCIFFLSLCAIGKIPWHDKNLIQHFVFIFGLSGFLLYSFWHKMQLKIFPILLSAVISGLIWGINSLIYIAFYLPTKDMTITAAYANIVGFISSIPITMNGWGVREFFSIKMFTQLGFSTQQCLTNAIIIGILSSLVTFILMLFLKKKTIVEPNTPMIKINSNIFIEILASACASFVFLQIHYKAIDFTININAADVLALVALLILVYEWFDRKIFQIDILHFFAGSFLVLFLGFAIGYLNYGFIPWAFYNKLLGWIVVAGYMSVGILCHLYKMSINKILQTSVYTLCVIIIFKITLLFLVQLGILVDSWIFNDQCSTFYGFAANRNAFCFQCLMMAALAVHLRYKTIILGILYVGIYLGASRTAYVILPFLILLQLKLEQITLKETLRAVLIGVTILLSSWYLAEVLIWSIGKIFAMLNQTSTVLYNSQLSPEMSNVERWFSIAEGLKIWWQNPLFGNGLGSFQHIHEGLVIHNSLVWLLAEIGIIGSLPFVWFYCKLWKHKELLTILIIFSVFALVHEVLYQRIFWLVLGLKAFELLARSENSYGVLNLKKLFSQNIIFQK